MDIKTKANIDLLTGLAREKTNKIVLLYSGGVDSTAAGLMLLKKGFQIYPLFFDYGQNAIESERYLVESTAAELGFNKPLIIRTDLLENLTKSKLLGSNANDDEDAWVPGRNSLFMIIAGIYAKQIDADGITLGYMLDDNFVFGDNDYFHHKSIEEVVSKSFLQPMEVFMPMISYTKKDLIKFLSKEGFLDRTVSCWNPKIIDNKVIPCLQCANCLEREKFTSELEK